MVDSESGPKTPKAKPYTNIPQEMLSAEALIERIVVLLPPGNFNKGKWSLCALPDGKPAIRIGVGGDVSINAIPAAQEMQNIADLLIKDGRQLALVPQKRDGEWLNVAQVPHDNQIAYSITIKAGPEGDDTLAALHQKLQAAGIYQSRRTISIAEGPSK